MAMKTLAIIGAGFSGTMVAVHLMRQAAALKAGVASDPLTIVLIERSGVFTSGIAYKTRSPNHLLNVPAGRMTAFEEDQDHFLRWARNRDQSITGGTFVPRMIYGEYLASVLNDAEAAAPSHVQLMRVPGEVHAIHKQMSGSLSLELAGGGLIHADRAVLAIGNYPPANPTLESGELSSSVRYARDPWAADALEVPPGESIVLLGTGLTMFDIAIALRDRQHRGSIYAVSRRGLMPQPHRVSHKPPPAHDRPKDIESWPGTALGLLRALRAEVKSAAAKRVDWREVITSLRADTPALWKSLDQKQRARFLRHVRPYWETHRHRAAPAMADAIAAMIKSGQLIILAARFIKHREDAQGLELTLRRRGELQEETLRVAKLINCTGPDTDLNRVREPLVRQLRQSFMIRPDQLGLGLDTDQHGAMIDAAGHVSKQLFLVGPLRKGQLWENTAVPELRIEAAMMATHLLSQAVTRPVVV